MSRHPIDDLFKQRLGRQRESIPAGLWEGIAARRAEARRKRRVLRWMYGGGGFLLLVLFAAAYFYGLDHWPRSAPANATDHSPTQPQSAAAATAPAPTAAPDTPVLSVPAESPGATAEASSAPSTTTTEPRHAAARRTPAARTVGPVTRSAGEQTGTSSWITRSRSAAAQQHKKSVPTAPTDTPDRPAVPAESEAPAERLAPYPPALPDEETGVSGPHRRSSSRQSASVQRLSPRDIRPTSVNESPSRRVANLRCYDISRKRYRFEAEWLAGPTLGRQLLRTRLDEAQAHLEDRRSTETARPGFGGGFRFSMVSPRGVALRTGLQYTELRNRFEYARPGESTTVITERYDPEGNVIGVDTSFSTEKLMYATTNRLRMIELPLLAGYEFQWNQLRVALTAGAHVNLWFDAQGQLLSPNSGSATDFGQVGDSEVFPIYTRQAGVGIYAGAAVLYHLGGRYSLLFEPFLKSYPRSLTRNEYVLRENYWMGGLQIGLRARL